MHTVFDLQDFRYIIIKRKLLYIVKFVWHHTLVLKKFLCWIVLGIRNTAGNFRLVNSALIIVDYIKMPTENLVYLPINCVFYIASSNSLLIKQNIR